MTRDELQQVRARGFATPEEEAQWQREKRLLQMRVAQRKYGRTAKGKAAHQRYRATLSGRRVTQRSNRKRIFIGNDYHGHAKTHEDAAAINAHIKERVSAFQRQQTRAETEGA